MYPTGTRVVTASGFVGTVVILFADGVWAKKFLECPWCDRATWEIRTAEANLTETGGPHYLIVENVSCWHFVDESRVGPLRDRITSGVIG
jgi:hypothetical protein